MCTLVVMWRPGAAWPLLAAANRDEMLGRDWDGPAAHWPDQPDVVGGRDRLAGGTWLAVRGLEGRGLADTGNGRTARRAPMMAGVLNRTGSLGPAAGKASRGDLPLMALAHDSAAAAFAALSAIDASPWRGFNLVLGDALGAYWLAPGPGGTMRGGALPPGVSVITAADPNDPTSPRVNRHHPRFAQSPPPIPPNWGNWPTLLSDTSPPWEAAINLAPRSGFGTVSASLIAIPATGPTALAFCPTAPTPTGFAPVDAV